MSKYLVYIRNKYRNMPTPMEASLWFTFATVLQKGINTLTLPLFARMLTTEEYGLNSVFNSWEEFITIVATLYLIGGVYQKGLLEFEHDKDGYTSAMQSLTTFTTLFVFGIVFIFKDVFVALFEMPFYIISLMFLHILVNPARSYWNSRQCYEYYYKKLLLVSISSSLLNPLVSIIFVMTFENRGIGRICATVLVASVYGIIIYIMQLRKGKKIFVKEYWSFAIKFNLPMIPHYISTTILNQSDRIMIQKICGFAQAGIYNVAYSAANLMTIVTSGMNSSLIPWTLKTLKKRDFKGVRNVVNSLMLATAVVVVILIAFAPEMVLLLAGKTYYEARWIVPPIACSVYFIFLYNQFSNIEVYYSESVYIMIASISGAALNAVLNLIFISAFGYLAAGYTTMVSYIVFCILHYIFMTKTLKKHEQGVQILDIRFLVIISTCLVGIMFIMVAFYDWLIVRYAIILVVLIVGVINRGKIIKLIGELRKK